MFYCINVKVCVLKRTHTFTKIIFILSYVPLYLDDYLLLLLIKHCKCSLHISKKKCFELILCWNTSYKKWVCLEALLTQFPFVLRSPCSSFLWWHPAPSSGVGPAEPTSTPSSRSWTRGGGSATCVIGSMMVRKGVRSFRYDHLKEPLSVKILDSINKYPMIWYDNIDISFVRVFFGSFTLMVENRIKQGTVVQT